METIIKLKRCIFIALVLLVCGGESQAKPKRIYKVPAYAAGRYNVTVINHVVSPVKTVQRMSSNERWNMIVSYLCKHTYLSIKEYAGMTGLSKKIAEAELDAFTINKKYHLSMTIVGKKKMYTLNG